MKIILDLDDKVIDKLIKVELKRFMLINKFDIDDEEHIVAALREVIVFGFSKIKEDRRKKYAPIKQNNDITVENVELVYKQNTNLKN
jgi:hypothetical protein